MLVAEILGRKQRTKTDQEYRNGQYVAAVSAIKSGDWEVALSHLCLSIGRSPSFTAYNAPGHCLGIFRTVESRSRGFSKSHFSAGDGPASPYPLSDRIPNPDEVCEFFHRESHGHARDSNWEFAYILSREALYLIREGRLPGYIEYGDCESWIRLVHMVAAIEFVEGSELISTAQEDANWIVANSRVAEYEML